MEKMNKKNKLIIFDMDGTLYDLQDVIGMNYEMQKDFYSNYYGISCDETEHIFREHDIFPYISAKAKSATEFFDKTGISIKQWQAYRKEHFDVKKIDAGKAVENNILQGFHLMYHTVLLTSNSFENVKKVFRHLDISLDNFDGIICSDYGYPYEIFDKYHAMKHIMEKTAKKPENCLSIGDRYETDIAPMLKLGGSGIVVKKPEALSDVYEYLTGRKACNENFDVYCPGKMQTNLWEDKK